MRKLFTLLFLVTALMVNAQRLFSDQFIYGSTPGNIVGLAGSVWNQTGTVATTPIQYNNASSLTFPGLASVGGKLGPLTTGQDINATFPEVSTGSIYVATLINVSSTQGAGDYFLHMGIAGNTSSFFGRTFIKPGSSAGTFNFGLMKNSGGSPPYSTTDYNNNTTYCVVLKYQFNSSSTTDDQATLFVFKPEDGFPATEPGSFELQALINTDANSISSVNLRQGASTAHATLEIDNVVVSTTWGDLLTTLPVALSSFTASAINNKAVLNWKTSNEVNSSHYVVEKSINGSSYKAIGEVASKNSATGASYTFTDNTSLLTTQYYRLKMVDKDGSFKYSAVVSLLGKETTSLKMYPNPVSSNAVITHAKAIDATQIIISSINGKRLKQIAVQSGSTQTSFSVAELPNGNYIVQVKNSTGTIRQSLQFQKR
jgi:hypothetical protein